MNQLRRKLQDWLGIIILGKQQHKIRQDMSAYFEVLNSRIGQLERELAALKSANGE